MRLARGQQLILLSSDAEVPTLPAKTLPLSRPRWPRRWRSGADQPLLKVADGPLGQRHDRGDASTQVTAQGLRPGDMAKPCRVQPGEGLHVAPQGSWTVV